MSNNTTHTVQQWSDRSFVVIYTPLNLCCTGTFPSLETAQARADELNNANETHPAAALGDYWD